MPDKDTRHKTQDTRLKTQDISSLSQRGGRGDFTRYLSLVTRYVSRFTLYYLVSLLCLMIVASNAISQEVVVLMSNGDQVTGSLLEYKDDELILRTRSGTLRISADDLVLIEFASSKTQISGQAYLHLEKGKQLLEMGMENEAIEKFRAAILESPMYADAYYELGVLLEKQGKTKEALEYIDRAMTIDPDRAGMARRLMELADIYFSKGQIEAAAERYYLLFVNYPRDGAAEYAVYRAGFLFAEELKNNERALAALEGAVAAFPKSSYADRGFYELGRIYEEQGSLGAAESTLTRLAADFPSSQWNDDGRYILARVYHRQRRNEDAIREIISLMNTSSDAVLVSAAQGMLDDCMWVVYRVADGLPGDDVRTLARDGDYLWVGTSAGITRFDLEENSFTDETLLPGVEVRALAADELYLWVGTQDSGVMRYDKLREAWAAYTEPQGPASNRAFAISIDSSNVWIGTALGGVYRYSKQNGSWANYKVSDGLSSNNILSIASTPKGVWCGTLKRGVCFFDRLADKWQIEIDQAIAGGRSVTSIATCGNHVWFAWYRELSNGVSKYDADTQTWEETIVADWQEYAQTANMVNLGASDKEMWLGTDTGILFYDRATSGWSRSFNYPSALMGHVPPVCVLVEDNSVWFATSQGLGRLDRRMIDQIERLKQR